MKENRKKPGIRGIIIDILFNTLFVGLALWKLLKTPPGEAFLFGFVSGIIAFGVIDPVFNMIWKKWVKK